MCQGWSEKYFFRTYSVKHSYKDKQFLLKHINCNVKIHCKKKKLTKFAKKRKTYYSKIAVSTSIFHKTSFLVFPHFQDVNIPLQNGLGCVDY